MNAFSSFVHKDLFSGDKSMNGTTVPNHTHRGSSRDISTFVLKSLKTDEILLLGPNHAFSGDASIHDVRFIHSVDMHSFMISTQRQ